MSRNFLRSLHASQLSIVIPTTVLLETANVLIRYTHAEISRVLEYMATLEIIPIDISFCQNSFPTLHAVRLKTADAILAVTARIFQTTLISWDKQLLKEAAHVVPAMTPSEYLEHMNQNPSK